MTITLMKHKLSRFWRYYILGRYHCHNCPYSWEKRGYEDADAGCYIFGELRDSCRLLPPFRFLIGWPMRKKYRYLMNHEYDDYEEFISERDDQEFHVHSSLAKYLKKHGYIVLKAWNIDLPEEVTPLIVPPEDLDQMYTLADDMRDIFTPPFEPLKTRWKNLIKATWKRFMMIFKPYFDK